MDKRGMTTGLAILVGVLVGAGLVLVSIALYRTFPEVTDRTEDMQEQNRMEENESDADDGEEETKDVAVSEETVFVVDWYKGAQTINEGDKEALLGSHLEQFKETSYFCGEGEYIDEKNCDVFVFEAGDVREPAAYAGQTVYWLIVPEQGMGLYLDTQLAVRHPETGEWIALMTEKRSEYREDWHFIEQTAMVDETGITAPEHIEDVYEDGSDLRKVGYYYVSDNIFNSLGASENAGGIVDVHEGTVVDTQQMFADLPVVSQHPIHGPVYLRNDAYWLVLADGSVWEYELVPPFLSQEDGENKKMYPLAYAADVEWNPGVAAVLGGVQFLHAGDSSVGMCGGGYGPNTNAEDRLDWFDASALEKIGETEAGEEIYWYADTENNPRLRELFDFGFDGYVYRVSYNKDNSEEILQQYENMSEEEKLAEFYSLYPMIYWQDPEGRWRSFRRSEFETLAECAKPVIYLYPEETMDVLVHVEPKGGFTVTEPVPGDKGWHVQAQPNGQLYSYDDGQDYPYLFWESKAYGTGGVPEEGFVLSKDEVPTQMRALLHDAGLRGQEIDDFMEFWEPKMTTSPYVFVTFVSQQAFELAAPLAVKPQPDYTLRVFMYFEHLEEKKDVAPLKLNVPPRKGFSVIEWGGAKQAHYDD